MTTKFIWYLGAEIPNSQEKVEREEVEQELAAMFEESGVTINEATGTWKGETEDNFLIEHIADEGFEEEDAEQIAQELKERFNQESVMVEARETNVEFV